MNLYLEFILIFNFLLDFMILYGTKRLLKINKKNYRLFLASTLGSLTTFLLFINISTFTLQILKIILSILMIIISFGKNNFKINIFYFYIISIIIGGTIYLFDLETNCYFYFIIIILVSFFVIAILIKEFLKYKLTYQNKYNVEIIYNNKSYFLEGFIDTGNRLASPLKKEPIILVNLKITPKKVIYVPYKALNTEGIITCIRPDKILINNKEFNHCLVGLSKDKFNIDGLNCILPNKFKEDL